MSERQSRDTADAEASPEVELLREENRRLRDAYRRTKRVQYRRTALGLALVGVLNIGAAVLFPSVREVLLVLGGIGVFAGVVTVYLTPERVLTATVSDAVYTTHATTGTALVEELGLQADHLYVPAGEDGGDVRVFRPQHADYELPERADSLFLVDVEDGARGAAVPAVGARLYREFEDAAIVSATPDVGETVAAVSDSVVEQFELADSVDYELEDGRVTVTVSGVEPGDVSRFDHPIVSLFGVALVDAAGEAVELASVNADGDRFTLTWPTD